MRFTATIGQSWRNSWKRTTQAAVNVLVLTTAAVVGLTVFGPKMLTACKAAGNAEQALTDGIDLPLLSFDDPEAKVERFQAKGEDREIAKNWKFTDVPFVSSTLAKNTALDYSIVTNPNTFNQIASNPALSPYANLIALSGAYGFLGNSLSQVYVPFVDNTLITIAKNVAPINLVLADFVVGFMNSINATVGSYLNALGAAQAAINASLPQNYLPPPVVFVTETKAVTPSFYDDKSLVVFTQYFSNNTNTQYQYVVPNGSPLTR